MICKQEIFLRYLVFGFSDLTIGTRVNYYYKLIKNLQNFSKDEIIFWQNNKLSDLIKHAYSNTVYYRELFDKLSLTPNDIKSNNDLKKIPILTKKIIKKNYLKLIPKNSSRIKSKKSSTGGSSGDPLRFILDLNSWSYITAHNLIYWEKYGYIFGDKHIVLGSSSLFANNNFSLKHSIYYKMRNKFLFNGVNMSTKRIKSLIHLIKSNKIKFIYGYASSVYLLAKFVNKNKISLDIKSVFCTSEILTDHYRNEIFDAFGCSIVDHYGAHDGGVSAFRMDHNMYEMCYNSIITTKQSNEISDIIVTNLDSFSMPFINYSLGDQIIIEEGNKINYNGQIIKKVIGRNSDVIVLENGNVITGPGFTILFKDLDVDAYRIVKEKKLHIVCEIIKNENYDDNQENIIISTLKKHAGPNCKIELKYIKDFYLTKSGKRNYFITK